jgi:hypothetical protein
MFQTVNVKNIENLFRSLDHCTLNTKNPVSHFMGCVHIFSTWVRMQRFGIGWYCYLRFEYQCPSFFPFAEAGQTARDEKTIIQTLNFKLY